MAAAEMYDYLSTVTPDYATETLNLPVVEVIPEECEPHQEIRESADGTVEEVVAFGPARVFYVTLNLRRLTAAQSGTLFSLYNDAAKADCQARSFKWVHPVDGHTYVVKFRGNLIRGWHPNTRHEIKAVRLKIVGRIADT